MKMEQMSIYDFLQDGESQEVAPSETLPQVDEAQVVHWEPKTCEEFEAYNKASAYPSSALDASDTVEVTDKALISAEPKFEVNQIVNVVNPYEPDYEDYDYMRAFEGLIYRIISIKEYPKGFQYEVESYDAVTRKFYFYEHELK
ncbi:hypothetical protein [Bacillus cereus]|uniref:hypothetical protein n=1 Tax=Bacillus cereus TaxID=1396 RepID=UPI0011A3F959|nr:hypothetical protein [Bacillus cereus]